ncbi:fungal specific transcription factor domain-containing protein [Sclerotinia borealis F-4128]|uniref:Fungal specific transcription factor domain-containing protein n=1 Tax=Sclerotinia borealis (strain F-4128) TaxID=1432307 RepID=W9CR19_SCLBF|nr:fungal specific transcription factor domain-containing protein [Sclerotinia borealis F-4128]
MAGGIDGNEGDSTIPKPKRIALRRKSGPKRGYVKALEERLKQVETMLKSQKPTTTSPSLGTGSVSGVGLGTVPAPDLNVPSPSIGVDREPWRYNSDAQPALNDMEFPNTMGLDDNSFWGITGLGGIEEPLPLQEAVDELHQIYFDNIHPSLPMIHKYRYFAAMNLTPNLRPPVSLRYAMWTLAASISEKYMDFKDHFYRRARKYMEVDALKGFGENIISVSHAQSHILLASYEFKMMYFPRAWMSTGAAIRLCQMMGLHRLDKPSLDVKQCIPPPRDWTEREERRRTFWSAFCEDRYASIGTGWPMMIDEKDIASDLPSSEEAFDMSKSERTQTLTEAMSPQGASKLSPFAGVVLMASLFGRNLLHLHRSDADDRDNDLNGDFWKRHRNMDNILLNTSLSLPFHLRLPHGMANPNTVFLNMNIHASTICLHQAAIFKAENNRLPASVAAESKGRAITAANEITSIMRMISHMNLSTMNPFISFCLYVAARVFVQYLASVPKDSQITDSLRFLLYAMNAIKKKNPLTESFLAQLDVDLESRGMRNNKKFEDAPWDENLMGSKEGGMPKMGSSLNALNFQPGCTLMRLSEDRGGNAFQMGGESPTNPQVLADMEQSGGRTSPSSRTNSFPQEFDIERNNWRPLKEHPQARDLARGVLVNQSRDSNSNTYSTEGTSTSAGTGLSPNIGNTSSHPTPNSTTPSDSRLANPPHGQNSTNNGSYQANAAPNTNTNRESHHLMMDEFFSSRSDYNTRPAGTAMTSNAFSMPETPGRTYTTPGSWGRPANTGLTPLGEGVFGHLMGLGHMDPMDIWEGSS